jgi:hypothetical protein
MERTATALAARRRSTICLLTLAALAALVADAGDHGDAYVDVLHDRPTTEGGG